MQHPLLVLPRSLASSYCFPSRVKPCTTATKFLVDEVVDQLLDLLEQTCVAIEICAVGVALRANLSFSIAQEYVTMALSDEAETILEPSLPLQKNL